MSEGRLLFVYGNDGGVVNGLIHHLHKLVSPATYDCRLCGLTYGWLGQRAAWTRALAGLGVESELLHRDEMIARSGRDQPPLPAVFSVEAGRATLLITKQEIEGCADLDAVIALVQARAASRLHPTDSRCSVPSTDP
jgi:hypothetical protein